MNLHNEQETVKQAATGDGAALARVCTHLQKIVADYQAHSTREIAEHHGRIEAKRLSIIACCFYPESEVKAFDVVQEEMIKQTKNKPYPVNGCEIGSQKDDEPQAKYEKT